MLWAFWLIHVAWERSPSGLKSHFDLDDVRQIFPEAVRVGQPDGHGMHQVFSDFGDRIGSVATNLPEALDLIGYSGPSVLLVGMNPDGRVAGVHFLSSGDTQAHVMEIRGTGNFWSSFLGWKPRVDDFPEIQAVSGSTLTSLAMAEGVLKKFVGKTSSLRFAGPLTESEIKVQFPLGTQIDRDTPGTGWVRVADEAGTILGFLVTTSPYADNIRGYQGPTEMILKMGADRETLLSISIRQSYDTKEYVDRVEWEGDFLNQLTRYTRSQWPELAFEDEGIEGVSGATQTSYAIAEGIRTRFIADKVMENPSGTLGFKVLPWLLLALVLGGVFLSFHPLRGHRQVRWVWHTLVILGFGIGFGQLFSLGLIVGWSRFGIPWQTQVGLVIVVGAALLVPLLTRRQVYCHQLCPHGLLQDRLGQLNSKKIRIPGKTHTWLTRLPVVILCVAFLLALFYPEIDLAQIEPFDAWVLGGAAIASVVLAVLGLVASLFIPQAYCKYGCPSGALLRWFRFKGSSDRMGTSEMGVVLFLILSTCLVFGGDWLGDVGMRAKGITRISGQAFATQWQVKMRGESIESTKVQTQIQTELDRIEGLLSSWDPDSATSLFNSAETTFEMEQPDELIELVEKALELSRLTDGAYDITTGPLINAWGFGPASIGESEPGPEEIEQLKNRIGYLNLEVFRGEKTMRKKIVNLELDLGSLLQGYAVDQVNKLLQEQGHQEYLIEIGGELYGKGRWKVAIENPDPEDGPIEIIWLDNQALAVSGNYRLQHLISPTTGYPVEPSLMMVAVLARSCLDADARATALMVSGLKVGTKIANDQEWRVLFLGRDSGVSRSRAWE